MNVQRPVFLLLALPALCLAACDDGDDTPDGPYLYVTGTTVMNSLNRLASDTSGEAIDFSDLVVELYDSAALGQAGAAPLADAPIDFTDCGDESPCDWSFGGVVLPDTATALVASIRDGRSSDPLWATTWATIASQEQLEALRSSHGSLKDTHTFAFTYDTVETVIAPLVGLSGEELLARGVVVGLTGGPVSGDERVPAVVGCTVRSSLPDVSIYYPTSNAQGLTDATANQGLFFAVPPASDTVQRVGFTITPPDGEDYTWDSDSPVWVGPNLVAAQIFIAR
jgi:hypothetical protein